MKIYIACLASYNNGTLHGKWIDATSDVDEMQEDANALLRSSEYPNVMVECPACGGVCRVGACSTCQGSGKSQVLKNSPFMTSMESHTLGNTAVFERLPIMSNS